MNVSQIIFQCNYSSVYEEKKPAVKEGTKAR